MAGYLFDTDAISEALKRKPSERYLSWLAGVPRDEQFTSAVVIGEMFAGAFRARAPERHARHIRERVLTSITVLAYDVAIAETYGRIRAQLEDAGHPLADADLQIAATALVHNLSLVTGNIRHFERVPGLTLQRALADARGA